MIYVNYMPGDSLAPHLASASAGMKPLETGLIPLPGDKYILLNLAWPTAGPRMFDPAPIPVPIKHKL